MPTFFSNGYRAARVGSVLLTVMFAAACGGAGDGPPQPPAVGNSAPPYAAHTLAGDSVDVNTLKGKVVLLNVWATWCAPCREEIPYLQQLHTERASEGLRVIGISVDAEGQEEKIKAFTSDIGMTYEIWRDPSERILSLYRAIGVPASYLLDRNGVLRWKHVGIVRPTDAAFTSALDRALADQ